MVRINGGIGKSKEECVIEWHEDILNMKTIVKHCCRRFNCIDKRKKAKLYNKNGIDLHEDDFQFIKPDDILYIALDGKIIRFS